MTSVSTSLVATSSEAPSRKLNVVTGQSYWETNDELQKYINESLPTNYNFEVEKTLARLQEAKSKHVVLQFPEGLVVWGDSISHIIEYFIPGIQVSIMGDVTYGACCIDDVLVQTLGGDFLVHYGHSCLVPINEGVGVPVLYIFVDISIDIEHFGNTIKHNFPPRSDVWGNHLAILSTVQYSSIVYTAVQKLRSEYAPKIITIPQSKPLSSGEVLGCTSPVIKASNQASRSDGCCSGGGSGSVTDLEDTKDSASASVNADDAETYRIIAAMDVDAVVFISDGRFHLESAMIQNPSIPFYKYDPFSKKITRERYDHILMKRNRMAAINLFRRIISENKGSKIGILQSTLGRQGSIGIVESVSKKLGDKLTSFTLLASELEPNRVELLAKGGVAALVQVACPRLSIDWGHFFNIPVITPYELQVAIGLTKWRKIYPMDFYAIDGGTWSNRGVEGGRMGSTKVIYENLRRDSDKGGGEDTKSRLIARLKARLDK